MQKNRRISHDRQSMATPIPTVSKRPSVRDMSARSDMSRLIIPLCLAVVIIALVAGIGVALTQPAGGSDDNSTEGGNTATPDTAAAQQAVDDGKTRMTLVAVGDSLPETYIGEYADAQAGEVGDGAYDYSFIFENIKPIVEKADISYINQEVHIGGNELGPKGYPSFNATDEIADAIVDTGFDLVASATNHSYDWGPYDVVEHSRSIWNDQPVLFTGTATSEEEASVIPVYEGEMSVAFLNYTYGVNGYEASDLPSYTVNFIDEDRIRADVERAHELADIVVVAMHWGTENQFEPDEEQLRYAQLLADLDVDVVIGSHPHVIGELHWVEGASGHKTLVAYSLGNFISHHETPTINNELEGMLSCDFVREGEDGDITIENVVWTPLVNHSDSEGASYSVYPLKDYTEELAKSHRILGKLDDPIGDMKKITADVIGGEFTIDD